MPDCDGAGTAKRSYPESKVGGWRMAERRYPASEVRGNRREELPHAPKPQARGGRGAMPCPRPGAVAGRTNPTSKKPWLRRHRRA